MHSCQQNKFYADAFFSSSFIDMGECAPMSNVHAWAAQETEELNLLDSILGI